LVKRPTTSGTFSALGGPKAKLLHLNPTAASSAVLAVQVRSLNLEHVSPAFLVQKEISRRTPLGQQAEAARQRGAAVADQTLLAVFRKWFWARKPDAGFLLEGFPATLLHALMFDEWLDARGESLSACVAADPRSEDPVVEHYRMLGLLVSPANLAAA
jgi:adenylate kinase